MSNPQEEHKALEAKTQELLELLLVTAESEGLTPSPNYMLSCPEGGITVDIQHTSVLNLLGNFSVYACSVKFVAIQYRLREEKVILQYLSVDTKDDLFLIQEVINVIRERKGKWRLITRPSRYTTRR